MPPSMVLLGAMAVASPAELPLTRASPPPIILALETVMVAGTARLVFSQIPTLLTVLP